MNRIVLILFLIFPLSLFSQSYINKSYKQVRKEVRKKEFKDFRSNPQIATSDSVIIFTADNLPCQPIKLIFQFDANNQCRSEEIITKCEPYFTKLLTQLIETKKYSWTKINENQYVSDFNSALMIEIPPENVSFSLTILRMDWSREIYDLLMKK